MKKNIAISSIENIVKLNENKIKPIKLTEEKIINTNQEKARKIIPNKLLLCDMKKNIAINTIENKDKLNENKSKIIILNNKQEKIENVVVNFINLEESPQLLKYKNKLIVSNKNKKKKKEKELMLNAKKLKLQDKNLELNKINLNLFKKKQICENIIPKYFKLAPHIKGYVINLKDRRDRLENFNYNIKNHLPFISIETVDAVHGKDLDYSDPSFLERLDKEHFKLINGISKGEVGCCLSHLKCYYKIINSNDDYAVIFEDDCIFKDEFYKKAANNFFKNLKIPKNFGIIYLNYYNQNLVANTNNPLLNKILFGNQTTESYIISKEYAKVLYNENINYIGPIDLHLGESMNKNKIYPFYILKDNFFIQADRTDSNIRGNGYQN